MSLNRGEMDESEPLLLHNSNRTTNSFRQLTQTVSVCIVPTVIKLDDKYEQLPPAEICGNQQVELYEDENREGEGKSLRFRHRQVWQHEDQIKCILLKDTNEKEYLFCYSSLIPLSIIKEIVQYWDDNVNLVMLHSAVLGFVYSYQQILTNFYNFCNESPVFLSTKEMQTEVALHATLDLMNVKCKELPRQYSQDNLIEDYLCRLSQALTQFETKNISAQSYEIKSIIGYFTRIEQAFFNKTHSITNDNYQMQMHRVIAKNLRPNMFLLIMNTIRAIWQPCNVEGSLVNLRTCILLIPLILFWFAYAALTYIVPFVFVILVYVFDRTDLGINQIHVWLAFVHGIFLFILDPVKMFTKRKSYKETKSFNATIEEAQLAVLDRNIEQIYSVEEEEGNVVIIPRIRLKSNRTESYDIMCMLAVPIIIIAFPICQMFYVAEGDGTKQNETLHMNSTNSSTQLFVLFGCSFLVTYMVYFILLCISVYLYWMQSKGLERYFTEISEYDFIKGTTRHRFNIGHPLIVQHLLLTIKCNIRQIKSNTFAATITACAIISMGGMGIAAFVIYILSHQPTNRSIVISIIYIVPVSILCLGMIIKVLSINEIITLSLPQLLQAKKHQLTNQILAKQLLTTTVEDTQVQTLTQWKDYLEENIQHMESRRDDDLIKILGFIEVNKKLLAGIITSALTSAISLLLSYGKSR